MEVKLSVIVDGITSTSEGMHVWLDRQSGELVFVDEWAPSEDEAAGFDEINDDKASRYLALPELESFDDYQLMQAFVAQQADPAQTELAAAIDGRGAFRHFRLAVDRLGLLQAWWDYRDAAYREAALSWCKANALTPIDDLPTGK